MKSIKEEKQMKPCADTAEDTHFSEGENEVAWPSNEKANRTATSNPAEVKVEEDQEGSDGMLYKTFNAGCVTDTNHSLPRREVAVKMEPVGDEDALPIQTIVQTQESTTGSISRVAEHSKSASVSKSPESLLEAVHPETPNGKETETESNPVSALPTIEVAGNSSPQDQQDLQGSKRAIRTISRPKYITRSVLNALRSPPCSSTTSDSSVSKVSTTATPAKTTSASPLEASSCSSRSATSNSSPEYSSSASSSKTPQRKKPNGAINQTLFPFNLARFLRAAIKSNPDVVYWSSTGNVFFINSRSSSNMEIIGQLVAPFFKHSNYDALRRQLNLYEFTRLTEGANKGGWYHPLFHRDYLTVENLANLTPTNRRRNSAKLVRVGARQRVALVKRPGLLSVVAIVNNKRAGKLIAATSQIGNKKAGKGTAIKRDNRVANTKAKQKKSEKSVSLPAFQNRKVIGNVAGKIVAKEPRRKPTQSSATAKVPMKKRKISQSNADPPTNSSLILAPELTFQGRSAPLSFLSPSKAPVKYCISSEPIRHINPALPAQALDGYSNAPSIPPVVEHLFSPLPHMKAPRYGESLVTHSHADELLGFDPHTKMPPPIMMPLQGPTRPTTWDPRHDHDFSIRAQAKVFSGKQTVTPGSSKVEAKPCPELQWDSPFGDAGEGTTVALPPGVKPSPTMTAPFATPASKNRRHVGNDGAFTPLAAMVHPCASPKFFEPIATPSNDKALPVAPGACKAASDQDLLMESPDIEEQDESVWEV